MRPRVLLFLPALCAIGVGLALFVVGAPRPVTAARVWGGPTEGSTRFAWRVELQEHFKQLSGPVVGRMIHVRATRADGHRSAWRGRTNELGLADVELEYPTIAPRGPVEVQVSLDVDGGQSVGADSVELPLIEWRSRASRRGGFDNIGSKGDLEIAVAPARGVFATGYPTDLIASVRDGGRPVAGADVQASFEGATPDTNVALTSADGFATFRIFPDALNLVATLEVSHQGRQGRWHAVMPVVAGAVLAERDGASGVTLHSAIGRDRAFYSIVDVQGRHAGGSVRLSRTGRGGSFARLRLDRVLPFWVVVGSEPYLDARSTVGWPFTEERVAATFDAPETLLLDGIGAARAEEQQRISNARYAAAALCILALLTTVIAFWRELRQQADPAIPSAGQPSRVRSWLSLVLIGLGFAMLALLALLGTKLGF